MINMMKRILALINSTLLYLFVSPVAALAITPPPTAPVVVCPTGSQFNVLCTLTAANFGQTLGTLVTIAFVGAIIVALGFLIYGGLKWIVSGGDKTAIEEARNHIISAVVGLVIVFLVFFILNLVVYFFTGQSLISLKLPSLGNP